MDPAETKHRKDVLEALSKYQTEGEVEITASSLGDMLQRESDRGIVIIITSFIEDALLDRILEELPRGKEARRSLVRGGPLRSFEQRVALAKAMDIIGRYEVETIDAFRCMRNACSHSRKDISFETPELTNALYLCLDPESDDRYDKDKLNNGRSIFLIVATFILSKLRGQSFEDTHDLMLQLTHEMSKTEEGLIRTDELLFAALPQKPTGK